MLWLTYPFGLSPGWALTVACPPFLWFLWKGTSSQMLGLHLVMDALPSLCFSVLLTSERKISGRLWQCGRSCESTGRACYRSTGLELEDLSAALYHTPTHLASDFILAPFQRWFNSPSDHQGMSHWRCVMSVGWIREWMNKRTVGHLCFEALSLCMPSPSHVLFI